MNEKNNFVLNIYSRAALRQVHVVCVCVCVCVCCGDKVFKKMLLLLLLLRFLSFLFCA